MWMIILFSVVGSLIGSLVVKVYAQNRTIEELELDLFAAEDNLFIRNAQLSQKKWELKAAHVSINILLSKRDAVLTAAYFNIEMLVAELETIENGGSKNNQLNRRAERGKASEV